MNILAHLKDNAVRTSMRGRSVRLYSEMTDEAKDELEAAYKRHLRACKRTGVEPDGLWLVEKIGDMEMGR